jgi:polyphosphate glucokinase
MATATSDAAGRESARGGLTTLAIDIGGSKLKASVLDAEGAMVVERVRVETPYPLPPERLVTELGQLTRELPAFDRMSVGFPGMVRDGRVLTATAFVKAKGPGSRVSPRLRAAWTGFDLAGALQAAFNVPARVVNDADMQGAAVVQGDGVELVLTLGTGFGTALFDHGRLCPHMEIAHHPFRRGQTYEQQLGEGARRKAGDEKWNRRLVTAVETLDTLLFFDHVYVGGGNAKRVNVDLGPKAILVGNEGGILGGIRLWDH